MWVTRDPRPRLPPQVRSTMSGSGCLCACRATLGSCSRVNGLKHSSQWSALGERVSRSAPLTSPHRLTYSPFPMLDVYRESLWPKLLLSQLIYIRWSDGVSAQSPSLESCLSHLILPPSLHLSLFSVHTPHTPPICTHTPPPHPLFAHSLAHMRALANLYSLWLLCAIE